jgi:transcriptional regulator with XRE-family HTH domain
MSVRAVAAEAGVSPSTVTRIENGRYQPKPELAEQLARAMGAKAAVRRRIIALAEQLSPRDEPRQVLLRGGITAQRKYREIEAASGLVRAFQPAIVPGLLQTEQYARAVFESGGYTGEDVDRMVRDRLGRREDALSPDGATRYVQILTEGALRWQVRSPEVMAEQCDLIAELARAEDRIRVGLVPWTRSVEVIPLHGFDLYDERGVIFGTLSGVNYVTAEKSVTDFVRMFEQVEAVADFGEQAATEAARIADDYRRLP